MSIGEEVAIEHELLHDAFGRVHEQLPLLLSELEPEVVLWRPDPDANPIGWLAWHLTRVQDDHLADVGQLDQVWTSAGFAQQFALPYPVPAHGYGQSSAEVGQFQIADTSLLLDYHQAVHQQTVRVIESLAEADFARIVDAAWDPPVTVAVRLVSVLGDLQAHLGQIDYVRGLASRR